MCFETFILGGYLVPNVGFDTLYKSVCNQCGET